MRFAASVAALLGLAASALAQTKGFDPIKSPTNGQVLTTGQTLTIKWDAAKKYAKDTVTISLIGGATQGDQFPIKDLATGIPNSAQHFSWKLDESLGTDAVYGLTITSDSNPKIFQYSYPFHIKKSTGGSGSASGYSAATSSISYATTMTTTYGVKTVHISSCPPTTTSVAVNTTTPVHSIYSSMPQNTTTTASYTFFTTTPAVVAPTTTVPAVVPTATPGAAARVGSSSLALIGALFVAALAL